MAQDVIEQALTRFVEGSGRDFDGQAVLRVERTRTSVRPFSVLAWVRLVFPRGEQSLVFKAARIPPGSDVEKVDSLRRRLQRECDIARTLRDQLSPYPELTTVEPVAFFPDLLVLVMTESSGETLYSLITRGARLYPSERVMDDIGARCFHAGSWLGAFQSATDRPQERFSLEGMRRYLEIRLEKLVQMGMSHVDRRWKAGFLRDFDRIAGRVSEEERRMTGVHGDFSLSNVLSTGAKTVVLDFSCFQYGSAFHDVTRFYHQLGLLQSKPYFRPETVERLRTAFLAGYGGRLSSSSPMFTLHVIQHHVCHWLGRMKEQDTPWHQRLFNRWVCSGQQRELRRLMAESAPHEIFG